MDKSTGHSGLFRGEFDEWIEKCRRRKLRRVAAYRRAIRQLKRIEADFGNPTGKLVRPLVRLAEAFPDNRSAGAKASGKHTERIK